MEHLIISFGLAVAVSFGVVLFAMILIAAITSSRVRPQSAPVDPARLLEPPLAFDSGDLAHALRGYDSPELLRDDNAARHHRSDERHSN